MVEVPIELPAKRKQPDHTWVSMEIHSDGCWVWEAEVTQLCGESYSFTRRTTDWRGYGRDQLVEIPYFDQVYRHLVDQHAANRTNPLGRFLTAAVEAMELALSERDGSRVYFARAGGWIKIGWSRNVAGRVTQLQTANAEPVRLLATSPGGRALERRLHEQFADARAAGEWFQPAADLLAYIDSLAAREG